MPVLAPIHREYGIERVNVATYQSVSGGGRSGRWKSWAGKLPKPQAFQDIEPEKFPVQIAFNLIPHINGSQPNGYTKKK